jgi:RNA polymerase sigma-70 factor, ECF subfamily
MTQLSDFEAAALPHMNDLFRSAVSMVNSRTEAEDLLQEVYLEAWKSFHRFEVGTNCRAWLFKILFHRVQHYRRRWYQWTSKMESEDLVIDTIRYQPPIPDNLTDEEILAALARIPEMFRSIVVLADVEEFSYKEIASMLGIPVGTVMSRLSRGRKYLREQLAGSTISVPGARGRAM